MRELGVTDGATLKARSCEELETHFGKVGEWLYEIVRGRDERPVRPNRERKSVGVEDTFPQDFVGVDACSEALAPIVAKLTERLENAGFLGSTLTLKIKFSDFSQITRSRTRERVYVGKADIESAALALLREHLPPRKPVRLLGVTLSRAAPTSPQRISRQLELPL